MFDTFNRLFRSAANDRNCIDTLETDIHSHLIPGIDDGSKSMEESLQIIQALHALGYTKLITTPHTMMHRYANEKETILRGLDTLRDAVANANIPVTIDAASEYYLDEHFLRFIKKKSLLTFGTGAVLFEMSYILAPVELPMIVSMLQDSGYTPVLAHPERYLYFHDRPEQYESLKQQGVKFQVNINSLGGYYSKPVQIAAKMLMERGWIDYLGSDVHHMKHTTSLGDTLEQGIVAEVCRKNTLLNEWL